jgi:hypothetical protein
MKKWLKDRELQPGPNISTHPDMFQALSLFKKDLAQVGVELVVDAHAALSGNHGDTSDEENESEVERANASLLLQQAAAMNASPIPVIKKKLLHAKHQLVQSKQAAGGRGERGASAAAAVLEKVMSSSSGESGAASGLMRIPATLRPQPIVINAAAPAAIVDVRYVQSGVQDDSAQAMAHLLYQLRKSPEQATAGNGNGNGNGNGSASSNNRANPAQSDAPAAEGMVVVRKRKLDEAQEGTEQMDRQHSMQSLIMRCYAVDRVPRAEQEGSRDIGRGCKAEQY